MSVGLQYIVKLKYFQDINRNLVFTFRNENIYMKFYTKTVHDFLFYFQIYFTRTWHLAKQYIWIRGISSPYLYYLYDKRKSEQRET